MKNSSLPSATSNVNHTLRLLKKFLLTENLRRYLLVREESHSEIVLTGQSQKIMEFMEGSVR